MFIHTRHMIVACDSVTSGLAKLTAILTNVHRILPDLFSILDDSLQYPKTNGRVVI